MTTIIETGVVMECDGCDEPNVFPFSISDESFPVEIECPHCHCTFYWLSERQVPTIPKQGPYDPFDPNVKEWKLKAVTKTEAEEGATSKKENETWLLDEVLDGASFRVKTNALAEQLLASLGLIDHLKGSLDELAENLSKDLEENWAKLDGVAGYRKGEIPRFILNPITSLPSMHETQRMNRMSCIAIVPSFYGRQLGVPVKSNSAYNLWFINPYTQITFPMESWLAESLNIEQPWEIEVFGNKVVGPDLPHVWDKIPDTGPDFDHDNGNPSIKILGPESRKWLAINGINPWPEKEVDLYENSSYETTELEAWGRPLWDALCKHGRIGVCGDADDARRFCKTALAMMRKSKAIVVPDEGRFDVNWNSIGMGGVSSHAYVKRGELNVAKLNAVDTVVVDPYLELDPELAHSLRAYEGNVILCRRESLTDCTSSNTTDLDFFSNVSYVRFPLEKKSRCNLYYNRLHLAGYLDELST